MARGSWMLPIGSTTLPKKLKRGGDVLVEALTFDSEACESIGKDVNENLAYVKIGNVCPNDHGVGMREDDAFFFFLGKGDGLPPESSNFSVAPFSDTEDLRMPNGTHVIFYRPIAGIGNRCTTADHVDLAIAWVFESRLCTQMLV
ncbi:unnamed protein product [Prunus armeniaca]